MRKFEMPIYSNKLPIKKEVLILTPENLKEIKKTFPTCSLYLYQNK